MINCDRNYHNWAYSGDLRICIECRKLEKVKK